MKLHYLIFDQTSTCVVDLKSPHIITGRQRSWAKVIFSQVCVKNSVQRGCVCVSACWDTPWSRHPPMEQTLDHPRSRHPWTDLPAPDPPTPRPEPPPEQTAPHDHTTPGKADCSIWSTSGRYASYWNAFCFHLKTQQQHQLFSCNYFFRFY